MKKSIILIISVLITIFPMVGFGAEQVFFDLRPRMTTNDDNGKIHTTFIPIKGVYAKIDIAKSQHALEIFYSGSDKEKRAMANQIEKNMGDYNPAALYALAAYYYHHNDAKRSCLISMLAEIRMAIDDACSTEDPSIKEVYELMQFEFWSSMGWVEASESEAKIKIREFRKMKQENVKQAIALDKQLARNYDRRWMYLLGMNATLNLFSQTGSNKSVESNSIGMLHGKQEQEMIAIIHANALKRSK